MSATSDDAARPRLLFLRPFRDRDLAYLRARLEPEFELLIPPAFDDATLAPLIATADAALGGRLSPALLDAATRLKFLQNPGAGSEGLDLAALAARGVMVGNSHSNAPYVAETALGLALSLVRRIAVNDRCLRAGRLPAGDSAGLGHSLFGARVGLIGFGHVGGAILDLLAPFRVQASAWVRRPRAARPGVTFASLAEVLAASEVIFASLPLTAATRGVLDREALAACRPGAVLVNVGRAEVIDRAALVDALAQGRPAGAALDVWWSADTLADAADFAAFDNVILSPHRAGTHGAFATHLPGAVDNLLAFARTGRPADLVDSTAGY